MNDRGRSTAVAAFRPGRGAFRHVRALAASLACVAAAFGAHVASGGQADPATVVAAFCLSGAVAWSVAGVRLSGLQMLGMLVLCQSGVHLASTTSGDHAAMGVWMLATHVGATVVSLVALSRGEAFVWAVAERLALRPLHLLRQRFTPPPTGTTIVSIPTTRPGEVLGLGVAPVRGPPAEHAFAPATS